MTHSRFVTAVVVVSAVAAWRAASVRAGGPWEPDPVFEAKVKAARRAEARWDEAGVGAVPELIAAACRQDELLLEPATERLVSLGGKAILQVIGAADTKDCHLGATVAAMVCPNWLLDGAFYGMLRDARPRVVSTALAALHVLVDREHPQPCRQRFLASAPEQLRELVRTSTGKRLNDVLFVVERLGPAAASLVPELIATLDKEDVAGNFAAAALGEIGPAAAPAVPALTERLRRGGKWSFRAPMALGGIGPAARPALPDFSPALKGALPHLCEKQPAYSEADVLVEGMARAVGTIGGAGVEPLVPDLVSAFQRERACLHTTERWLDAFAALEGHGSAAAPAVLALLEDPDERVAVRRQALHTLERIGSPFGSWLRVRRVRKALERKAAIFDAPRPDREVGVPQVLPPPPPPPPVPEELGLCRQEADLAALPAPADAHALPGDAAFSDCVEYRLCGPDEETYRATITRCCAGYGAAPPWFCRVRATKAIKE